MKYIINDSFIYDSILNTLSNVRDSMSTIELTPKSVSILLTCFITNPNVLLSREQINKKSFSDTNYSGSNSNINKSLSTLRRLFKDIGCDEEIIKTIPLQGFIFNATVIEYNEDASEDITIQNKKILSRNRVLISIFFIFFIVFILCFLLFHNWERSSLTYNCSDLKKLKMNNKLPFNINRSLIDIDNCNANSLFVLNDFKTPFKDSHFKLIGVCDTNASKCLNVIEK